MDVEQHGARCVGGVSAVYFAASQAPEQKAVYRAKTQFAAFGTFACSFYVLQEPAQFSGRKVGVDQQAGELGYLVFVAGGFQLSTEVGGAAVLPNDSPVQQLARFGVPEQGGFALIGNTDPGNLLGADTGLLEYLTANRQGAIPDVFAVVLYPAVLWKVLSKLLLRGELGFAFG